MSLPTLYTDHLVLRPWTEQDIHVLHRLWTDSDVFRYLFDGAVINIQQASALVRDGIETAARTGLGFWSIHLSLSTSLLGFCGFSPSVDKLEAELLYGLLPRYWGQGFATEACLGILSYLWSATAFTHVYAKTDELNEKSLGVIQRLGMRLLGTRCGPQGQPLLTYVLDRPRHF